MMPDRDKSRVGFGAPVRRLEDRRLLTGAGRFADNLAAVVPACRVYFLRSPHAHARIRGISTAAAASAPGVIAILTGPEAIADELGHLPALSEIKDAAGLRHREPAHLPMVTDKARHVGEIVAMIVADTLDHARDAAELV